MQVAGYGSSFILPSFYSGLNKTNGLTVIPETEGDVTFPSNLQPEYPLYWQLPKSFLGDKVIQKIVCSFFNIIMLLMIFFF